MESIFTQRLIMREIFRGESFLLGCGQRAKTARLADCFLAWDSPATNFHLHANFNINLVTIRRKGGLVTNERVVHGTLL